MKSQLTPIGHIINILVPAIETNPRSNPGLSMILAQARERILTAMLRATTVLAFLALFVSLPALVCYEQWFAIGFYSICLGAICLIALNRKIAYRLRAGLFLLVLYSVGLLDLMNYGLGEDGRIFLCQTIGYSHERPHNLNERGKTGQHL